MSKEIISEKDLERTFSEHLNRTKKVWVIKLLSTFIKGLPDRMILCQGGYVGFAEIKTTGKKPTKIQTYIHEKLRALGFKVFVIDDLESRDAAISFFLRNVKEINNVPGRGLSL
ncbi:nuclease [Bacteroides phage EMB2]|nr:nuclease [Bacteroides phage EMB2]